MRRIFLFLATNFAIILILGIVAHLLGADRYLTSKGLDLSALLVFSFIFGMGGSLISLQISRWGARRMTRCRIITTPNTDIEQWLHSTVKRLTQQAGLPMPQLGIFPSLSPNAFATGPSKSRSLIAVSEGLLTYMNHDQVEAVLAHEVSHIRSGDMVTLALIQGVLNTFVFFFARVVGYGIDLALKARGQDSDGPGIGYYLGTIVAQIFFSILASIIVLWFSRKREYRADHGAAQFTSREKMISALEVLGGGSAPKPLPDKIAAFGIQGRGAGLFGRMGITHKPVNAFSRMFMTHPPIEDRINALKES
jgi:heat shock protein HtpX